MITSETFYRAECDKCPATIPNEDDHEASHWPLSAVEDALREPREASGLSDVEVTWFYDGERTLCPEHHPEAQPCGTCNGQGSVRREGPPPQWTGGEWKMPHHWVECPECHWVGFHPAPTVQPSRSEPTSPDLSSLGDPRAERF